MAMRVEDVIRAVENFMGGPESVGGFMDRHTLRSAAVIAQLEVDVRGDIRSAEQAAEWLDAADRRIAAYTTSQKRGIGSEYLSEAGRFGDALRAMARSIRKADTGVADGE